MTRLKINDLPVEKNLNTNEMIALVGGHHYGYYGSCYPSYPVYPSCYGFGYGHGHGYGGGFYGSCHPYGY